MKRSTREGLLFFAIIALTAASCAIFRFQISLFLHNYVQLPPILKLSDILFRGNYIAVGIVIFLFSGAAMSWVLSRRFARSYKAMIGAVLIAAGGCILKVQLFTYLELGRVPLAQFLLTFILAFIIFFYLILKGRRVL